MKQDSELGPDSSGAPVSRGDLHSKAVRIDHGKVIVGVALHFADAGIPHGGPKSFGVEIIDADAKVIDAPGVIGPLQDDQPTARQVEPVVVRPLDPSRSRQSE